jgi:hypothetical protein
MEIKENKKIGDVLSMEGDDGYSRDTVTIASGAGVLEVGEVLGKITADGKFVSSPETGSDGSETAVAVLLDNVDATSADVTARVAARHATVKTHALTFDASIDDTAKRQAKIDQLKTVGILTRKGA